MIAGGREATHVTDVEAQTQEEVVVVDVEAGALPFSRPRTTNTHESKIYCCVNIGWKQVKIPFAVLSTISRRIEGEDMRSIPRVEKL